MISKILSWIVVILTAFLILGCQSLVISDVRKENQKNVRKAIKSQKNTILTLLEDSKEEVIVKIKTDGGTVLRSGENIYDIVFQVNKEQEVEPTSSCIHYPRLESAANPVIYNCKDLLDERQEKLWLLNSLLSAVNGLSNNNVISQALTESVDQLGDRVESERKAFQVFSAGTTFKLEEIGTLLEEIKAAGTN